MDTQQHRNEQDPVVQRLHRLGRLTPTAEQTRRAMARARGAAMQTAPLARRRRPLWRTLAVSAAAASVMIGIALVLWLAVGSPSPASAAEKLDELTQVNAAYKGWVHTEADLKHTTVPKDAPRLTAARIHLNTSDGTSITDQIINGERVVEIFSPSTGRRVDYRSGPGTIRITDMDPDVAKAFVRQVAETPVSLMQYLTVLRKHLGVETLKVTSKTEDALERFDLAVPAKAREVCTAESGCPAPAHVTLWVHPKTRLVRRFQTRSAERTARMNVTYGEPVIRDIYDLGVPRTAKVVDNRVQSDAAALLNRLDKRLEEGLGDCVAIQTSFGCDARGKPNFKDRITSVWLFARQGKAWLSLRYLLGDRKYPNGSPRVIAVEPPTGWPEPKLSDFLAAVESARPGNYWVFDGSAFWTGWFEARDGKHNGMGAATGKYLQMVPSMKAQYSPAGQLWPTRKRLNVGTPGVRVSVVRDDKRPGLIGLKVNGTSSCGQGDLKEESESETVYWLDPARDDLPAESTWTRTSGFTGGSSELVERTRYLGFAQLPDKRWYPTKWRSERKSVVTRRSKKRQSHSVTEHRLRILPGQQLPKKWYDDPRKRLPPPAAR